MGWDALGQASPARGCKPLHVPYHVPAPVESGPDHIPTHPPPRHVPASSMSHRTVLWPLDYRSRKPPFSSAPIPMEPPAYSTRRSAYFPPTANASLHPGGAASLADIPRQLRADISASHRQLAEVAQQNISHATASSLVADSPLVQPISERTHANSSSQRAVLCNLALRQVTSGILSIHPMLSPRTSVHATARVSRHSSLSGHQDRVPRMARNAAVEPMEVGHTS